MYIALALLILLFDFTLEYAIMKGSEGQEGLNLSVTRRILLCATLIYEALRNSYRIFVEKA
jgi:hypothetical protein